MNRIGSFARMEYYETSGQIWNVKYTKTKARQTEQRLTATDLESKSESSRSRSGCVVMKQLDLSIHY